MCGAARCGHHIVHQVLEYTDFLVVSWMPSWGRKMSCMGRGLLVALQQPMDFTEVRAIRLLVQEMVGYNFC